MSAMQVDVAGEEEPVFRSAPVALPADGKDEVRVYGDSKKGAKQYQEDSFCWRTAKSGRVFVLGVFDGHGGYNGRVASNTARKALLTYFSEATLQECEKWSSSDWTTKLSALFASIHQEIRKAFMAEGGGSNGRSVDAKGIVRGPSGDPIHGGTTGSVVVAVAQADGTYEVIGANTGDSTALLITERGNFEFMSEDHGPDNADEYKRIMSLDAKTNPEKLIFVYDKARCYKKYECPRVFLENGTKDPKFVQNPWGNGLHPTNVRYEPAVYAVTPKSVSRDATCIAMTRALGDFYAGQFGLSSQPSFKFSRTKAGEDCIISVASDGIWDCWRYENHAKYVCELWKKKGLGMKNAVNTLLTETITRAISNFGASHYDDACVVLCSLPARKI